MFYLLTSNKSIRPTNNYAIGYELLEKIEYILSTSLNTNFINDDSDFSSNSSKFNFVNKNKN